MNPAGDHPPKDRPLPPNVVEVSAALIFQCGKILLTQRPPGSHLAGLWEFPGGKREPLETFEQCLVREIREELGITIAVGRLFDSISHQYPQKSVLLKFFVCRLLAGVPRPCLLLSRCGSPVAGKTPELSRRLAERSGFNPENLRIPG